MRQLDTTRRAALLAALAALAAPAARAALLHDATFDMEHAACAVQVDRRVFCWGKNEFGVLGNGPGPDSGVPGPVDGLENARTVQVGVEHACALTHAGEVYCWGAAFGLFRPLEPGPVLAFDQKADVMEVGVGATCIVGREDGLVRCVGVNLSRRMSAAPTPELFTFTSEEPALPALPAHPVRLAVTRFHVCAQYADGSAACTGEDDLGIAGNVTAAAGRHDLQCSEQICAWRPTPNELVLVGDNGGRRIAAAEDVGFAEYNFSHAIRDVALSDLAVYVVLDNGDLYISGSADDDQFDMPAGPLEMELVESDGPGTAYVAGVAATCRATETRGVECRGGNEFFALGRDSTDMSSTVYEEIVDFDALALRVREIGRPAPAGPPAAPAQWIYLDTRSKYFEVSMVTLTSALVLAIILLVARAFRTLCDRGRGRQAIQSF